MHCFSVCPPEVIHSVRHHFRFDKIDRRWFLAPPSVLRLVTVRLVLAATSLAARVALQYLLSSAYVSEIPTSQVISHLTGQKTPTCA